jgi:hypothetical protein
LQIHHFQNGLSTQTALEVRKARPRTLAEAIDVAHANEQRSKVYTESHLSSAHGNRQNQRAKRNLRREGKTKTYPSEVTCYNCEQKGHYSSSCPSKGNRNPPHAPIPRTVGQ